MDHLPIRTLFGDPVIGNTGEGTGFGHQVTGRDLQGIIRFGSPVAGNREEEAGSGPPGIGNTDNQELRVINQSIIITRLFYKIPPHLPFSKGGTIPLFGKEGLGEIFRRICLLYYGLISKSYELRVMSYEL